MTAGAGDPLPKTPSWWCLRRLRRLILVFSVCLLTALYFIAGKQLNLRNNLLSTTGGEDAEVQLDDQPIAPRCQPRKNIAFLKTHKCASSSVQNIIMRYGYRHHLVFMLQRHSNYIGHPLPFSRTMVPDQKKFGVTYSILTHHCRLNYTEIRSVMPPDTLFVTIVRDPVQLFESLYSYYDLQKLYKEKLEVVGLNASDTAKYRKRSNHKHGINQMLFDLGFNDLYFDNETLVKEYIAKLESQFDLVMVAEKMEESLILLKELLCWDLDDVIAFKVNARNRKFLRKLAPDVHARLQKLNNADQILYDHFVRSFDRRVEEYGLEKMTDAVEELQNRTQEWYDFCVQKEDSGARLINRSKYYTNPKVMGFLRKENNINTTCVDLTTQEIIFTEKIYLRQKHMYPPPRTPPPPKRRRTTINRRYRLNNSSNYRADKNREAQKRKGRLGR